MDASGNCRSHHLALVIVSYRSERWLPRCIESIYDGRFEGRCWLIDNDSLSPGLRDEILARYPLLSYHRTGENLGFGGANNLGIRFALDAGADIVGLINPDIWLEPGWCPPIVAAFEEIPGLGLAAPLQLQYENDEPAEWTRSVLGIESMTDPRLKASLLSADWLEGSALFIKRKVFESIGKFDPLFKLYYEDNDLCRRARLAGFAHAVVPTTAYHHFGGGTLDGRAGVERGIRCDLGQALYVLTNPERHFSTNVIATGRLISRRLLRVVRSREGRRRFVGLVSRLVPLVWHERSAIYEKWKTDAARRCYCAKNGEPGRVLIKPQGTQRIGRSIGSE